MAQKKSTAASKTKKSSAKKTTSKKAAPKKSTKKFLRNATYTPFRLRLERHDKDSKPIQLKPRGQRGDFAPLQKEDLHDPDLQANVSLGAVEIITESEAQDIATKQTVNQQATHPALQGLRNELDQPYSDDAVKVTKSHEDQGVVVAELDDGNVVVDRGTGIRRRGPGATPGTPAEISGAEPNHQPANEDPAYLSDLKARQKNAEGPEAGLGGIQRVVVNETQKE